MSTRVGITGHRWLGDEDTQHWIAEEIDRALDLVSGDLVGVGSLAQGADRIFAEVILARGAVLEVVLPFPGYRGSGEAGGDQYECDEFLARATHVEELPAAATPEAGYLAAGHRVVDRCQLILAVWDGQPAQGPGGTAEIVDYARRCGRTIIIMNPASRTIAREEGSHAASAERFYGAGSKAVASFDLPAWLQSSMPYALPLSRTALDSMTTQLADVLGLPGPPRVISVPAHAGVMIERALRRRAWDVGDPYRLALHRVGIQAYAAADQLGWGQFSAAFSAAEELVNSDPWRVQLRALSARSGAAEADYLRRLFRSAQQTWTRAARWLSVIPPSVASPFEVVARLAAGGAWPVGSLDGSAIVLTSDEHAPPQPIILPPPSPASSVEAGSVEESRGVFLATELRNGETGNRWADALKDAGYRLRHGPVPEREEPLELTLGRRIRGSAAVVAIVDQTDPLFGLRMWIEQELEYAVDSGVPAVLVCGPNQRHHIPAGVDVLETAGAPPQVARDFPLVRSWIDAMLAELE